MDLYPRLEVRGLSPSPAPRLLLMTFIVHSPELYSTNPTTPEGPTGLSVSVDPESRDVSGSTKSLL